MLLSANAFKYAFKFRIKVTDVIYRYVFVFNIPTPYN